MAVRRPQVTIAALNSGEASRCYCAGLSPRLRPPPGRARTRPPPGEQTGHGIHVPAVARADGRHLDYLAVDELDPVVLVEHARLARAVVLVHGEAVRGERHGHTMGPPRRAGQDLGMAQDGAGAERARHREVAGEERINAGAGGGNASRVTAALLGVISATECGEE
jgi:hypothetical protein